MSDGEAVGHPPNVDDAEDHSLDKLISSDGEELLAFVDEIRQIDGLGYVKLDFPQVCEQSSKLYKAYSLHLRSWWW